MSAITETPLAAEAPSAPAQPLAIPTTTPDRFWCGFWGLLLCACVPFLVPYMRSLWNQELYQYFPFLLLAVGYLFYTRWDRQWVAPSGRLVWWTCGAGISVLLVAAVIHSSWLGAVAFILLSLAFFASQRSLDGRSLGYLALPLVMFIRVPQLHAQSLVVRLQKVTTELTSLSLDMIGVPHDAHGNAIHLASKDLFVAEACSGIQSAFTMCFLGLLIIVWRRRPLITAPLYFAAALVLAVLANTLRVTVIAIAEAWYRVDLSSGWMHDAVGYLTLAIAAAILLSFDSLSALLFHSVEVPVGRRGANPLCVTWNFMLGVKHVRSADDVSLWAFESGAIDRENGAASQAAPARPVEWRAARRPMAMAGVAALASVVMLGGFVFGRSDRRPIVSKEAVLFDPPEDFLDGRFGILAIGNREVVRNGTDPQLGLHADIWQCGTTTDRAGQLVMSQPYVGWHELCVCYEVQDWELLRRYNLPVKEGKPVAVGEFTNAQGLKGYLVFTAIDSDGTVPTPPSYTLFGRLLAPFGPLITDDFAETSGSAQTIMLQLWTVSAEPLEETEIGELANSVSEVRQQARERIVHQQRELLAQQ